MVRQHKKAKWFSTKQSKAILEALKKARTGLDGIDRVNLPPESLLHKELVVLTDFYNEVINAIDLR